MCIALGFCFCGCWCTCLLCVALVCLLFRQDVDCVFGVLVYLIVDSVVIC